MITRRRHRGSFRHAGLIALALTLFATLPWFAAPVLAVSCPDNGSLTNANVSPGSGTLSTNFTFSVTYQDNLGGDHRTRSASTSATATTAA